MKLPVLLVLTLLVAGCTPKLSPLYRDYAVTDRAPTQDDILLERIGVGLSSAGWTVVDGVTDNVVATEARQFREWGLYSVRVSLEVAPVGGDFVRLLVHPYRHYFTGAQSKIPYLRPGLAESVLDDLHEAFEAEGLTFIGTAQSRDREARGG